MPWEALHTEDGNTLPALSCGTAWLTKTQWSEQLRHAMDMGITHFDLSTVDHAFYLRRFLEAEKISRTTVFISAHWAGANSSESAAKLVERILNLLATDKLDLLLLDEPRIKQKDIPSRWAEMEKLKKSGLVRNLGVMDMNYDQIVELFMQADIPPTVHQLAFTPYSNPAVQELVTLSKKLQMNIMARDVLEPVLIQSAKPSILLKPLIKIAKRVASGPNQPPTSGAQVILAWARTKDVAPMFTKIDLKWQRDMFAADHVSPVLTRLELALVDVIGAERFRRDASKAEKLAMYESMAGTATKKALSLAIR